MSVYGRYVLPRLTDLVMRNPVSAAERAKFVPRASGIVLEIGIGSALNLPFYTPGVEKLYGVDPSGELWTIGRRRLVAASFPVEFLHASAERIPLAGGTIDSIVSTWTLCSIPDPRTALAELKRVLKPDGQFIFVEHGWAPDSRVQRWQDRLTPIWKRVAGGCHLNRKIGDLVREAGFALDELETSYASGPRPFTYLYRGVARAAA